MKKAIKILAALVAVVVLLTLLAACGGSKTGEKEASTIEKKAAEESKKPVSEPEKPTPITFLTTGDMAAKPLQPDDRIVAEINKRLNIVLTVKAVPQNAWEKINVAMASGDLPDVVVSQYPTAAVNQWIKDGIIVPLNDYLDKMPTVKEKLNGKLSWTAVDGKFYGYPFIEERSNWDLCYRGDILDELGIKPPATLDEFYEIAKVIVKSDPDGNGKNDTYAITGLKAFANGTISCFDWVFYAYGLPYADYVLDGSGNVTPKFGHPSFKEGMIYLKKLWSEKLIEPEFMLNDIQKQEEKFAQAKAAFVATPLFRNLNRVETIVKKVNPNGRLEFIEPPKGPGGKSGISTTPKGGMLTAVTKAAKNPEKAAMFIEFLLSKEGRDLLQLGIEGVHYKKNGDRIEYIEAERAKDGFSPNGWAHPLAWGHVVWPLTLMYLPDTEPQKERAIKSVEVATKYMMPNLIPLVPAAEIEYGSVVNDIYNQYFLDMLVGKIDVDKGIQELGSKWRAQGGDKILKEANEIYQKYKK